MSAASLAATFLARTIRGPVPLFLALWLAGASWAQNPAPTGTGHAAQPKSADAAARAKAPVADWHIPLPFDDMPEAPEDRAKWLAGAAALHQDLAGKLKAPLTLAQAEQTFGGLVTFWSGRSLAEYFFLGSPLPARNLTENETKELQALLDRTLAFIKAHADPKEADAEKAAWEKLPPAKKATLEKVLKLKPWLAKLAPAEKLELYKVPEGYLKTLLRAHEKIPAAKWTAFLRTRDYSILTNAFLESSARPSSWLGDLDTIVRGDLGVKLPEGLSLSNRNAVRNWIRQQVVHLKNEETHKRPTPPGLRQALEMADRIYDDYWLEVMAGDFADTGVDVSYPKLKQWFGALEPTLHEELVRLWQVMKKSPRGKKQFLDFLKSMPSRTSELPTCQCFVVPWEELKQKEERGTGDTAKPYQEMLAKYPFCRAYVEFRLNPEMELTVEKLKLILPAESKHPLCLMPIIASFADAYDRKFGQLVSSGTVFDNATETVSVSGADRDARREAAIQRALELARSAKTEAAKDGLPPDPLAGDAWLESQVDALARQQLVVKIRALMPDLDPSALANGSDVDRQAAIQSAAIRVAKLVGERLPDEKKAVRNEIRLEAARRLIAEVQAAERAKAPKDAPKDILARVRASPKVYALMAPAYRDEIDRGLNDARESLKAHNKPELTAIANDEAKLRRFQMDNLLLGEHGKAGVTPVDAAKARAEDPGSLGEIGKHAYEGDVRDFLRENLQACVTAIENPREADKLREEADALEREARRILHASGDPTQAAELWKKARLKRDLVEARYELPDPGRGPSSDALYGAHEDVRKATLEVEKLNIELKHQTAAYERGIQDTMAAAQALGWDDSDFPGILGTVRGALNQLVAQKGKIGENSPYYKKTKKQLEDRIAAIIAERRALVGDYVPPSEKEVSTLPIDAKAPVAACGSVRGKGEKGGKLLQIEQRCQEFAQTSKARLDKLLEDLNKKKELAEKTTASEAENRRARVGEQYRQWATACVGALKGKSFPPGFDPAREADLAPVVEALTLYSQRRHETRRLVEAAQAPIDESPDWSHPLLKERLASLKDEFVSGRNPFKLTGEQWEMLLARAKKTAKETKEASAKRLHELLKKLEPYGIAWDGLKLDYRNAKLWLLNGKDENERVKNMEALKDTLVRLNEFGDYGASGTSAWIDLKRHVVEMFHASGVIPRFTLADTTLRGRGADGNFQNRETLVELVDAHGNLNEYFGKDGKRYTREQYVAEMQKKRDKKPYVEITEVPGYSFETAWDKPDDFKFLRLKNLPEHLAKVDKVLKELEGNETGSYALLTPEKRDKLKGLERRFAAGETLSPEDQKARDALRAELQGELTEYIRIVKLKKENKELSDEDEKKLHAFEKKLKPGGLSGDFAKAQKDATDDASRLLRGLSRGASQEDHDRVMGKVTEVGEALNRKLSELMELSGNFMVDPGAGPMGNASFLALQKRLAHEFLTLPQWKDFDGKVKELIDARGAFGVDLVETELITLGLMGAPKLFAEGGAWARRLEHISEIAKLYRNGVRIATVTKLTTEDLFGMPRQDMEQFVHQAHHMGKMMALTYPLNLGGAALLKTVPPPWWAGGVWAARLGEYALVPGGAMAATSFTLDMLEGKSGYHAGINAARMAVFGIQWDRMIMGALFRVPALGTSMAAHPTATGYAAFFPAYLANAGLNAGLSAYEYSTDAEVRAALREQGIHSPGEAAWHGMKQSLVMDLLAASHAIGRERVAAIRRGLETGRLQFVEVVAKYGFQTAHEAISQMRLYDLAATAQRLQDTYGLRNLENGTAVGHGSTPEAQAADLRAARDTFLWLREAAGIAGLNKPADLLFFANRLRNEREAWVNSTPVMRRLPEWMRRGIIDAPETLRLSQVYDALMRAKREEMTEQFLARNYPSNAWRMLEILSDPTFSVVDSRGHRHWVPGALDSLTMDHIKKAGVAGLISSRSNAAALDLFAQLASLNGMPVDYVQRYLNAVRLREGERVLAALRRYHPDDSDSARRLLLEGDLTVPQARNTRARLFGDGVVDRALNGTTLRDIAGLIRREAAGRPEDAHLRGVLDEMARMAGFTDPALFRRAVPEYVRARSTDSLDPGAYLLGGRISRSDGSEGIPVGQALRAQVGLP